MLHDYENYIEQDSDWVRKDSLPDLEHIKDHLQGIIEAVYETGDVFSLEFCLDEICSQLGVEIKLDAPVLKKAEKQDVREWEKERYEELKKYA